jgi:hypothetical protein
MVKKNTFIVEERPLIEVLRKFGKGPESKDYEYMVSIYMKRKLEESYNEPFCISFEVKKGKLDPRRSFTATSEELNEIIRNQLEEDTPMDFGLVKGAIEKHDPSGFAFQVKKFIGNSVLTFNEDLVNYINQLFKKFRPGEVNLIILPSLSPKLKGKNGSDINVALDWNLIKSKISPVKDSFLSVFILTYDNRPIIKQLWP